MVALVLSAATEVRAEILLAIPSDLLPSAKAVSLHDVFGDVRYGEALGAPDASCSRADDSPSAFATSSVTTHPSPLQRLKQRFLQSWCSAPPRDGGMNSASSGGDPSGQQQQPVFGEKAVPPAPQLAARVQEGTRVSIPLPVLSGLFRPPRSNV